MVVNSELKVLRYIYKFPNDITLSSLRKKFKKIDIVSTLKSLDNCGCISIDNPSPRDSSGFPISPLPESSFVHILNSGIAEVECRKYFTFENIMRDLVLPLAIGVISTLITVFLIS